jgi:5-(carboxyamino)imidazole ribonucleotide synthase
MAQRTVNTAQDNIPGLIRVGVLGGGQLGRMLGLAGIPLGMQFTFFDPSPDASAAEVGTLVTGEYDDDAALARFCDGVDVVTFEFENVPVRAAEFVAARRPVWPPVSTLGVAQDRIHEKECFRSLGVPTAPFARVDSLTDLEDAVNAIGAPGVLKTRTLGYDGKGQTVLRSADDVTTAWELLGGVPLIYEGFIHFTRELSILAVRAKDGRTAFYPLVENVHSEGILRLSTAPAPAIAPATQRLADEYAGRVLERLQYVGVLAIELFETPDGLIANEMAPRVHNSGHWTIEGAETSQFENHVRAVCDLPLGDTSVRGHAAMLNLIGTVPPVASMLDAVPGAHVHLYGKCEKPRRKVGHVTVRASALDVVRERVAVLRRVMSVG